MCFLRVYCLSAGFAFFAVPQGRIEYDNSILMVHFIGSFIFFRWGIDVIRGHFQCEKNGRAWAAGQAAVAVRQRMHLPWRSW
jgi:hypothetical protein